MKWIIFFYVLNTPAYHHEQVDCIVINEHTVHAFGEEWYITPSRVKMKKDTYRDNKRKDQPKIKKNRYFHLTRGICLGRLQNWRQAEQYRD